MTPREVIVRQWLKTFRMWPDDAEDGADEMLSALAEAGFHVVPARTVVLEDGSERPVTWEMVDRVYYEAAS